MKRLQIMIEEDMDLALARKSRAEGTSKAELIRRYVRYFVEETVPLESDPLWDLMGAADFDPEAVHDVVYR